MQQIPFINDFWQFRMNRLMTAVDEESVSDLCKHFWSTQRQDKRQLTADEINMEVHTFDKELMYKDAFIDLSITMDPFLHKYRLLSGHAALRTALADGRFRKVIGVLPGNFRELSRSEIEKLCARLVEWFEAVGNLFPAPFSQFADILRNWLKGVYDGISKGSLPSLFAVEHLLSDKRSLIIETANALLGSLQKLKKMKEGATVAVLGAGLWAESVAVTLRLNGYDCRQVADASLEAHADVLLLVDAGVRVKKGQAEKLRDVILIEMLPEQVDHSADLTLRENGVLYIPDLVAAAGEEIVEKWLLSGEGVDTWEHFLNMEMDTLVSEILETAEKHDFCHPDATLLLALQRLKGKLIEE